MKKRLLFFSSEPGGSATLAAAVRALRPFPWEADIMAYGHGLSRFRRDGLPCREVAPTAGEPELRAAKPAVLVTSAGSLPLPGFEDTERRLWTGACRLGIPSVALIDSWQHYAERFSGTTPQERLAYLPDRINALNEVGREEMLSEGFPANRLVTLGHPAISELPEKAAQLDRAVLRARFGLDARKKTLLFVSEPLRQVFGRRLGYDQYDALAVFLREAPAAFPGAEVLVKLHPKDDRARFPKDARLVQDEATALECVVAGDAIFGMTSVVLIEAFALGKPVVSFQPGLAGPDAMVLSRRGLIPRIGSLAELGGKIPTPDAARFPVAFDSAGFSRLLEELAA